MNQVKILHKPQSITPPEQVQWRVRGLRGATTVDCNSASAIAQAVDELLNKLVAENSIVPQDIISVVFSVTSDITASVARQRPGWDKISLLDVQHMAVGESLERCIRVLIHLNVSPSQQELCPVYLNQAAKLRPDLAHSN